MSIDYKNDERLNIVNVAIKCGIEIVSTVRTSKRVLAKCPFCDDKKGHLYLTLEGTNGRYNVYKCVRCGEHGTNIDLYSKIYNVDRKTAFKELLGNDITSKSKEIIKKVNETNINIIPAKPVEYLDKVYRTFLSMLDLSFEHKSNLLKRGLSLEYIKKNNYKSLPVDFKKKNEICLKLSKAYDLKGVPGFYVNDYGYWDMYCPKGMLIRSLNKDGLIQGFQIRLDEPKNGKRYKYFSSSGFPKSKPNGTKADAHVHISYGIKKNSKRVGITEGPLKADIATYFTGITFFAIPGVNVAQNELVDTLKTMDMESVDICFDMDILNKPEVKKALNSLISKLKENNINYNVKKWEKEYLSNKEIKGIDDYLLYKYMSMKKTRTV